MAQNNRQRSITDTFQSSAAWGGAHKLRSTSLVQTQRCLLPVEKILSPFGLLLNRATEQQCEHLFLQVLIQRIKAKGISPNLFLEASITLIPDKGITGN